MLETFFRMSDFPPPKKYSLKQREIQRLNTPELEATHQAMDIAEILRENQLKSPPPEPPLKQKPWLSRRMRHYLIAMTAGNAFFVSTLLFFGVGAFSAIFGLSGIVLFSTGLTWAMLVVMEDY